jgi:hypothetical protein
MENVKQMALAKVRALDIANKETLEMIIMSEILQRTT